MLEIRLAEIGNTVSANLSSFVTFYRKFEFSITRQAEVFAVIDVVGIFSAFAFNMFRNTISSEAVNQTTLVTPWSNR